MLHMVPGHDPGHRGPLRMPSHIPRLPLRDTRCTPYWPNAAVPQPVPLPYRERRVQRVQPLDLLNTQQCCRALLQTLSTTTPLHTPRPYLPSSTSSSPLRRLHLGPHPAFSAPSLPSHRLGSCVLLLLPPSPQPRLHHGVPPEPGCPQRAAPLHWAAAVDQLPQDPQGRPQFVGVNGPRLHPPTAPLWATQRRQGAHGENAGVLGGGKVGSTGGLSKRGTAQGCRPISSVGFRL